jgi:N-acetylneuraminate synthase
VPSTEEIKYLEALVRGVYARRDLEEGYVLDNVNFSRDFYLAIPLQKGQLSCQEVFNGEALVKPIPADAPLTVDDVDGPYSTIPHLRERLMTRGL